MYLDIYNLISYTIYINYYSIWLYYVKMAVVC